jgi:anaerobic ribonucleoside-triphosphate reductase activating protein
MESNHPLTINVHSHEPRCTIYGPGERFVIWVQGCTLACKGCWNVELWDQDTGLNMKTTELLELIESEDGLEGITFLGGEPLEQAPAVLELIGMVRDVGLSIFLYTGYEISEFDETMQACFDDSDIVVTGRYVNELRNTGLRWRGSENQEIHFPSNRYDDLNIEDGTDVEVIIDQDTGLITILGYPDPQLLREIRELTEGMNRGMWGDRSQPLAKPSLEVVEEGGE